MKQNLAIAKDHPAYEGHFPGRPLLPGVLLLAEAIAALKGDRWSIDSAKFLMPVEPGTALTLVEDSLANGTVRFEIESPGGVVATGVLSRA
jgi:3-hydroxymyristoyl/3-hydroxydecanoyl-(acyl carrier protein) dehydratase